MAVRYTLPLHSYHELTSGGDRTLTSYLEVTYWPCRKPRHHTVIIHQKEFQVPDLQ